MYIAFFVIVVVVIIMGTLNAICCIANDTENYRDIYLKVELVSCVAHDGFRGGGVGDVGWGNVV